MTEPQVSLTASEQRLLTQVGLRFGGIISLGALLRLLLTAAGALISTWYYFAAVFSIAALVLARTPLSSLPRSVAIAGAAAFAAATLVILGYPWTSRDQFLGDFSCVRPGMRSSDVEALMGGYVAGPLHQPRLTSPVECQTYHHSFEPAWNADLGEICYRDGIVVDTYFSPD